jgi:hypothetical protein
VRREVYTGLWWRDQRERGHLEDPGIDGRIISRWIFTKWEVGGGMDMVVGTCKYGNEPTGSIKCRGFLD